MDKSYNCCVCGFTVDKRTKLKKLKSGYYCSKCFKERRAKRRDIILHEVAGVRRRSELEKEWKEKRELREKMIAEREKEGTGVVGIKDIKHGPTIGALGMWLTKEEKEVLYWKYRRLGMNSEEANQKLDKAVKFLSELIIKLRNEHKSDKQINDRFKEEYAKLYEREK